MQIYKIFLTYYSFASLSQHYPLSFLTTKTQNMRKILLLCMLVPLLGASQTKNIVSAFRVFPKVEKSLEFEKAFTAHAQKYHTGNWKWRVFEIQSGPDAGGFHVVEGPLSWEQFDTRGNLGAEHTADWAKNVMILSADRGTSSYAEFNEELSTVKITDYSDKILLNHMLPMPGRISAVLDMMKKMKKAWEAGGESVAVYEARSSGAPEIVTATRLKNGLKELDDSYRKPFPERFASANGDGSWNAFMDEYAKNVERRWSEMLFYRADLSSK